MSVIPFACMFTCLVHVHVHLFFLMFCLPVVLDRCRPALTPLLACPLPHLYRT